MGLMDYYDGFMEYYDMLHERFVEPVYRRIGIYQIVKLEEKVLGRLDPRSRYTIEDCYASAGIIMGISSTDNPENTWFYVSIAVAQLTLGFLHHAAMGNRAKPQDAEQPETRVQEEPPSLEGRLKSVLQSG